MTLYQNKYRIESNRWQFWNYSAPGSYFLTVTVQGRNRILGRIENSKMKLSDAGIIVSNCFVEIPTYHKRIVLDEWVIMPNHFHCIITLGDIDFDNGVSVIGDDIAVDKIHVDKIHEFYLRKNQPTKTITVNNIKQYRALRRKMLIPKIMGKLKMQTSKQINILNNTAGNKNWQSDYHDHVIRSSSEHLRIKQYIKNNPLHWKDDTFNK
ncbi:MAG: transposase [Bacteroidetes bacterium]|nr:transposase [Bacteroidota bacterium]